jgi:hypothetical protein
VRQDRGLDAVGRPTLARMLLTCALTVASLAKIWAPISALGRPRATSRSTFRSRPVTAPRRRLASSARAAGRPAKWAIRWRFTLGLQVQVIGGGGHDAAARIDQAVQELPRTPVG